MSPSPEDLRHLRRDKYDDDPAADMAEDMARLAAGEPLAYVIGWVPFLGLRIYMEPEPALPSGAARLGLAPRSAAPSGSTDPAPARTLIPRPETEWWTEKMIEDLRARFGARAFALLDLCAGSGAIGLAVLNALPNARVTFAELEPAHAATIHRNAQENGISPDSFTVCTGDLFSALGASTERFDTIATNPPYVPEGRTLDRSVTAYEPPEALYAGEDGLSLTRRIAVEAPAYLADGGALWLECDSEHAEAAKALFEAAHAEAADEPHGAYSPVALHNDLYGRPRLLVAYWSHG